MTFNRLVILLLLFLLPSLVAANIIEVKIKGIVCTFCSLGVRKNLIKTGKVKSVVCNTKNKISTIYLKKDKSLSDKEIREAVKKAGYSVYTNGIVRKPCKPVE
jgi:mercuric ion binding protein